MTSPVVQPAVFDTALAVYPTQLVPLSAVVDLLTETHDPERVRGYASAMRSGVRFPPISVVRGPGRYLVADGHKRLAAYRALGTDHIVVEIWTWRRWFADQCGQGVHHGRKTARMLRLGLTDPREAFRVLRTTTGHWARVARSLRSRLG